MHIGKRGPPESPSRQTLRPWPAPHCTGLLTFSDCVRKYGDGFPPATKFLTQGSQRFRRGRENSCCQREGTCIPDTQDRRASRASQIAEHERPSPSPPASSAKPLRPPR